MGDTTTEVYARIPDRLRAIAKSIDSQAAISDRSGQLGELEQLGIAVRQIAHELDGRGHWPSQSWTVGWMASARTSDAFRYYQLGEDYYWRALENRGLVEFWDGENWRISVLPNRLAFLDDALAGGGVLREVFVDQLPAELRGEGKGRDG